MVNFRKVVIFHGYMLNYQRVTHLQTIVIIQSTIDISSILNTDIKLPEGIAHDAGNRGISGNSRPGKPTGQVRPGSAQWQITAQSYSGGGHDSNFTMVYTRWCPSSLAKLVNISPISLWFL